MTTLPDEEEGSIPFPDDGVADVGDESDAVPNPHDFPAADDGGAG